jgi:hypothetical protein
MAGSTQKTRKRTLTQSHSTAAYQHHGNYPLLEGHHAWTAEMADKNESETCTSWQEHAQMRVLDQQLMPRMPPGQQRWQASFHMPIPKMQGHSLGCHTSATTTPPDAQDGAPPTRRIHSESTTLHRTEVTSRHGDQGQQSSHCNGPSRCHWMAQFSS